MDWESVQLRKALTKTFTLRHAAISNGTEHFESPFLIDPDIGLAAEIIIMMFFILLHHDHN